MFLKYCKNVIGAQNMLMYFQSIAFDFIYLQGDLCLSSQSLKKGRDLEKCLKMFFIVHV